MAGGASGPADPDRPDAPIARRFDALSFRPLLDDLDRLCG
jgi:hypothetical protein